MNELNNLIFFSWILTFVLVIFILSYSIYWYFFDERPDQIRR